MGCCLSREDDRFNSGSEALLPKSKNGNKRVKNSVDVNLAKKEGANGSYKSPSAVVAAGDATSKVSAKPQLPKKAVESVDLLGLNDKTSTPLAAPMIKAPSVPKPTSTVELGPTTSEPTAAPVVKKANSLQKPVAKEPSSSKPTESSLPKRTSSSKETKTSLNTASKKPMVTEMEELVVSAFTSVSVKAEGFDNDNVENNDNGDENDKDNKNDGDSDEGDNDGKALDKPKDSKPKKNISSKKSKKKRKKGKK